jgi:hypothetical protein
MLNTPVYVLPVFSLVRNALTLQLLAAVYLYGCKVPTKDSPSTGRFVYALLLYSIGINCPTPLNK